jgi:hypothetical protein
LPFPKVRPSFGSQQATYISLGPRHSLIKLLHRRGEHRSVHRNVLWTGMYVNEPGKSKVEGTKLCLLIRPVTFFFAYFALLFSIFPWSSGYERWSVGLCVATSVVLVVSQLVDEESVAQGEV